MFNTCSNFTTRKDRLRALRPFFSAFLLFECSVFGIQKFHPVKSSPLAYVFAIGMSLFLIAMIGILIRLSNRQCDEFQRKLTIEAALWSIGGTLALTTLWGCLEVFTDVPHVPILATFPIFVTVMAIAKVTLFRSNPVGEE